MDESTPEDVHATADRDVASLEIVRDKESNHVADTLEKDKPSEVDSVSNFSTSLQALTDKTLHFLAHASNETLGACLVGLGATTYFIFGRVGLVAIGIAGGVVLHATWDGIRSDDRDEETKRAERERRREAGIEVAKRVLEWRSQRAKEDGDEEVKVHATEAQLDYSAYDPKTSQALTVFTDAFIKDYVFYWYGWSLPDELNFPNSARRTFTAFMLSLANHLQRKRPADAFLDFTTNASSIVIVFLNELSAALAASPNSQPAEAIGTYLELKPDTTLSYLLDQDSQNAKLKDIAEDMLRAYLDPKAYNFPTARVFCKEVLAQLILGYTVTTCSRPEWINEWIVYLLEESETTKEVMNIVDAGVEGRAEPVKKTAPQEEDKEEEGEHRKRMDKAEEVMDEAMQEAKRLTQMMIEEDERRTREEQQQQIQASSAEDISEKSHTQGAPTPTSSQSDRDGQEFDSEAVWSSQTSYNNERSNSRSVHESDERSSTPDGAKQFLNFDQIVPHAQPTALSDDWSTTNSTPTNATDQVLTLFNATISIFDDSVPGEKASIKAKPQTDYLIQIEPATSFFPGWMIARKYADFESLHEVLRRISVITGVVGFAEAHADLPKWKQNTKASLRSELEKYLTDAVKYQPLAESEGMKRFLEKDQQISKKNGGKGGGSGLGWKLGNDMMSALSKAPNQVAGGGKMVLGGVTGSGKAVFDGVAGLVGAAGVAAGSVGTKKQPTVNRTSTGSTMNGFGEPQPNVTNLNHSASSKDTASQSQDSFHTHSPKPSIDRQSSFTSMDSSSRSHPTLSSPTVDVDKVDAGSPTSAMASPTRSSKEEVINLPPRPSEMPEEWRAPGKSPPRTSAEIFPANAPRTSTSANDSDIQAPAMPPRPTASASQPVPKAKKPAITDAETSVVVELLFAVITELYTLSSAWNFRRTLLAAARTYLLRPGSQHLGAIRDLLQSSLLDANLSDEGVAAHIYKLRENALPTEEELEQWKIDYPEKTAEEKEALRLKARKLLVQKGMPAALQSVMGAAASGEALGKVFDCLQVESVSRGLIFGLMVQGLKVVTQ